MLVRHLVFVKQLFHVFGHHVVVIQDRDKAGLFPPLGYGSS
jgi:hypothetical protein